MQLCPECEKPIGHHAPICPFCGTHVERAKAANIARSGEGALGCLFLLFLGSGVFVLWLLYRLAKSIPTWSTDTWIGATIGLLILALLILAIWGIIRLLKRLTRREIRYLTSRGVLTYSELKSQWMSDWMNDALSEGDFILDEKTEEFLGFEDVLARGKYRK